MSGPVFISHSSKDAERVSALVAALEARGVGCWVASRDIKGGENYGDAIVDALERAGAMVLVFSANANASEEIKKEISLASQRGITVIPARIEDTQPSKMFRYELATRQWIDVFDKAGAGVDRLAERLRAVIGESSVAPPSPNAAAKAANAAREIPSKTSPATILAGLALLLAVAGAAGWAWFGRAPAAPSVATPGPAPTPTPTPTQTNAVAAPKAPPATSVASPTPAKPENSPDAAVLLTSASPPARPGGGETFRECQDCPEMVVAPAGKAIIGSPRGEPGRDDLSELDPHEVDIDKPFAIGRYDVTFAEWDACVADGGCARRPPDFDFGRGRRPVIFVSWTEAQAYAGWLSGKSGRKYRLPSEAEWEYAARGCAKLDCEQKPFWFGAISPDQAVYDWRFSYLNSAKAYDQGQRTQPVDRGPPNPFGLYNVLGNVRQWTLDCWASAAPAVKSPGAASIRGDCTRRVTRGGSWNEKPAALRAAARAWAQVDDRTQPNVGFRVVRELDFN